MFLAVSKNCYKLLSLYIPRDILYYFGRNFRWFASCLRHFIKKRYFFFLGFEMAATNHLTRAIFLSAVIDITILYLKNKNVILKSIN
jgi:hypothetical protein